MEALGAELAEAIPELLRLAQLEVRIPRLEVVALERLAARDGKSVDAVLARDRTKGVSRGGRGDAEGARGELIDISLLRDLCSASPRLRVKRLSNRN